MIQKIVKDKEFLATPAIPYNWGSGLPTILIGDLLDTAKAHKHCLGLSASQVGSHESIFIMNHHDNFIIVIDPVVKQVSKEMKTGTEFCMSFPGVTRKIKRHRWIVLEYLSMNGIRVTVKFTKRSAIIAQHELDHLKGILI